MRFIILHGAIVVVKILNTHHRRSPLVQGGLELPIQVIVKMEYHPQNKDALFKYDSLVEQCYKEPGVDGKFEDITKTVLKDLESDANEEIDSEAEDSEQAHDESGGGVREDMEQAADRDTQ